MAYQPLGQTEKKKKPKNLQDPFYALKQKMQVDVAGLSAAFESWKDLLANTNTATSPEFAKVKQQIQTGIKRLQAYGSDISRAISIVEANRKRFKNIDDSELEARKKFANDCKALVLDIIATMNSPRSQNKIDRDAKNALLGSKSPRSGGGPGTQSGFIQAKQAEAKELVNAQDEILTDMTSALDRLKGVSVDINSELNTQGKLVDTMGSRTDMALAGMETAFSKMDEITGRSSAGRYMCILILCIIIFVEFLLIMYL